MTPNRDNDLRMLREALEFEKLDGDTRLAFEDMLDSLATRRELSEKQRAWVRKVLDEPDYENAVSSGKVSRVLHHNHGELAACTAACPSWTPPTLASLPKKPPARRTEGT